MAIENYESARRSGGSARKRRHQRGRVRVTATKAALGMENFFTCTETWRGENSSRIIAANSVANDSIKNLQIGDDDFVHGIHFCSHPNALFLVWTASNKTRVGSFKAICAASAIVTQRNSTASSFNLTCS